MTQSEKIDFTLNAQTGIGSARWDQIGTLGKQKVWAIAHMGLLTVYIGRTIQEWSYCENWKDDPGQKREDYLALLCERAQRAADLKAAGFPVLDRNNHSVAIDRMMTPPDIHTLLRAIEAADKAYGAICLVDGPQPDGRWCEMLKARLQQDALVPDMVIDKLGLPVRGDNSQGWAFDLLLELSDWHMKESMGAKITNGVDCLCLSDARHEGEVNLERYALRVQSFFAIDRGICANVMSKAVKDHPEPLSDALLRGAALKAIRSSIRNDHHLSEKYEDAAERGAEIARRDYWTLTTMKDLGWVKSKLEPEIMPEPVF